MSDLIEALQIFILYTKDAYPTICEEGLLHVCVDYNAVRKEHIDRLYQLGFNSSDACQFQSTRFGGIFQGSPFSP